MLYLFEFVKESVGENDFASGEDLGVFDGVVNILIGECGCE